MKQTYKLQWIDSNGLNVLYGAEAQYDALLTCYRALQNEPHIMSLEFWDIGGNSAAQIL